jgi:uncharacterized protein YajQ (UPF0234 family)
MVDFRESNLWRGFIPSLIVVSSVDLQSWTSVNYTKREVASRFDFRSVKTEIEFDRKEKVIHIVSGDDWIVRPSKT